MLETELLGTLKILVEMRVAFLHGTANTSGSQIRKKTKESFPLGTNNCWDFRAPESEWKSLRRLCRFNETQFVQIFDKQHQLET